RKSCPVLVSSAATVTGTGRPSYSQLSAGPGQIATRHSPGVTLSEKEPSVLVTVSANPPPPGWKAPTYAPVTGAPATLGSLLRNATRPWFLASLETSWKSPRSTVAPSPAGTVAGDGPSIGGMVGHT